LVSLKIESWENEFEWANEGAAGLSANKTWLQIKQTVDCVRQ